MAENPLLEQAMQLVGGGGDTAIPTMTPTSDFSLGGETGISAREALYQQLKNRQDLLTAQRSQAIAELARPTTMSNSETAAMLLIGLLPSLVGGVTKGKKGLAAGAEAGALGSQTLAKGIEADAGRRRLQAQTNVNFLDEQLSDLQNTTSKAQLDEINAADTAQQKQLDREAQLGAAAIRAGGDKGIAGGLKELAAAYKVEKASRESESTKKSFVADNVIYSPTGAVTQEKAEAFDKAADLYDTILESITSAKQKITANQSGAAGRVVGDLSDEIAGEYDIAKNALAELKKIPGLKGTESFASTERLLKDPTGFINNLRGALGKTVTVKDQLLNTEQLVKKDFDRLLRKNNFQQIPIGSVFNTKSGQKVKVLGVLPDGSLDYEEVK